MITTSIKYMLIGMVVYKSGKYIARKVDEYRKGGEKTWFFRPSYDGLSGLSSNVGHLIFGLGNAHSNRAKLTASLNLSFSKEIIMTLGLIVCLIVLVVGLVLHFASNNPKVVRISELSYLAALLVLLAAIVNHPMFSAATNRWLSSSGSFRAFGLIV